METKIVLKWVKDLQQSEQNLKEKNGMKPMCGNIEKNVLEMCKGVIIICRKKNENKCYKSLGLRK